jgi:hypothetical protein
MGVIMLDSLRYAFITSRIDVSCGVVLIMLLVSDF